MNDRDPRSLDQEFIVRNGVQVGMMICEVELRVRVKPPHDVWRVGDHLAMRDAVTGACQTMLAGLFRVYAAPAAPELYTLNPE